MRKIVIRIDDICPKMNLEKMNRFEAILDKYGICPLIGVVPDCKDDELNVDPDMEDFSGYLKDKLNKGWVIAIHGYEHLYTTKKGGIFPLNNYSEFAGIPFDEQYNKLCNGKELVSKLGVNTDIFMAPAHSYDNNTLKALKKAGYKYVTDGFGKTPYEYKGLTFLPISMLKSLEKKGKDGYTTFVVHTATMRDEDFEGYDKLFSGERDRFVNYSELFNIKAKKRLAITMLFERLGAMFKHTIGKVRS